MLAADTGFSASMFARVYMDCNYLLLLLLLLSLLLRVRVRFGSIEIFIRYDVRVWARSTRSNMTLFSLREWNIDNGRCCMMG